MFPTYVPGGCHEQVIQRQKEGVWLLVRFWEWWGEKFCPYRFCKQLQEGKLDA